MLLCAIRPYRRYNNQYHSTPEERRTGVSLRIITMLHNKSFSLSDLIRDPDAVIKDFNVINEEDDIKYVKEYGIGIDCHSKFIEVCIRYRNDKVIQKAQAHFSTNWDDLVTARDWCIEVLNSKANPTPNLSEPLHYLVESTATGMHGMGWKPNDHQSNNCRGNKTEDRCPRQLSPCPPRPDKHLA